MNTISVNHAAAVAKTETGDLKKNDLLNCVIDRERERERGAKPRTECDLVLDSYAGMLDAGRRNDRTDVKKDVRSVKEAADVERRGEGEGRKRERTEATARSRK